MPVYLLVFKAWSNRSRRHLCVLSVQEVLMSFLLRYRQRGETTWSVADFGVVSWCCCWLPWLRHLATVGRQTSRSPFRSLRIRPTDSAAKRAFVAEIHRMSFESVTSTTFGIPRSRRELHSILRGTSRRFGMPLPRMKAAIGRNKVKRLARALREPSIRLACLRRTSCCMTSATRSLDGRVAGLNAL